MLVIFDCDGVLVDSEAIYIEAELAHLARQGVVLDRADYMRRFMGLSPADWRAGIADLVADATGVGPAARFFDLLAEAVHAEMDRRLAPIAGVPETLAALGVPICVASSTPLQRLHWKLDRTGLSPFFGDRVFSASMVAKGKPAPDLFLYAAKACGHEPGRCIVVEDSVNGVLAGRSAGMAVIGFCGGGHCDDSHGDRLTQAGATQIAGSFAEICTAIGAIGQHGG